MRESVHPTDTKNFAIGVLSTTAVILFVGLLIVQSRPSEVYASGMTTSGGGYIMTVGAMTQNDEEVVYVLDTRSQKLVVYRFDGNRREIQILQGIDLSDLRKGATPPGRRRP